ncbi:MAG: ribosome biogenesis GTPase Der, partial [Gammaproteobacteria bacterium]|nr:ribosome biogenesis GTPase Der [Gammaproteobacteria bacterium]
MNVIALVGRTNVGKSTLFNRFCGRREALVHDRPGLTRDRRYGKATLQGLTATVIDVGGVGEESALAPLIDEQVDLAINEANLVLLVIDGESGFSSIEEDMAKQLHVSGKNVLVVLNKVDANADESLGIELNRLGFGLAVEISALNGRGIPRLVRAINDELPDSPEIESSHEGIKVALVGRSNVGKSTLINTIVEDKRCIVFDEIGTTRDAIDVPLKRPEGDYVLIDTAGIRRKGRVSDVLEKFSILHAFKAMDRAQVALLVIDAAEGVVDQDLHILQYAAESGTGLILVANKWDTLDRYKREQFRASLSHKLKFADWITVKHVSALTGAGVDKLFPLINQIYENGKFEFGTPEINDVLQRVIEAHPPPAVNG